MNLRYAILRHEAVAEPHFDLLFETAPGSMLAAWRAPRWPITRRTRLLRLPDHRPLYLDYEGPVSGDRGRVNRVAGGAYRLNVPAEFNVGSRVAWEMHIPSQGAGGLLIRGWTDHTGAQLWDATAM